MTLLKPANVTFTTGNGPDTIVAGPNDIVQAGTGPDTLVGANGATLYAGSGSDTLYGAPGETLVGGSGPDTFAFEPGFGQNAVSNFHASNDVVQFNPSLFANYAAMMSAGAIVQSGANTVITDHAGDTVTLTGVAASSLTAHNFHFADIGYPINRQPGAVGRCKNAAIGFQVGETTARLSSARCEVTTMRSRTK